MDMRKYIGIIVTVLVVLAGSVLGFVFAPPAFSSLQKETFLILLIICGASALYCFVVGEISGNNSQMDKLWSILPIVYTWVIAAKGGFDVRLVVYAIIATMWGIRLTYNFAKKGAYRLKFWEGKEDYRWSILRSKKPLSNRALWGVFDLFFICIYQNALVLAITLPALACMESPNSFGAWDVVATVTALGALVLETIADLQQMAFHTEKNRLLAEGKKLEELPAPYNKGFNTIGLWKRARHPNYFGEQAIWVCLYIFVIGAGAANYGIFNWSMIGPLMLILLFLGSSAFGESISASKYPEYSRYASKVSRYIPLWKYKEEK